MGSCLVLNRRPKVPAEDTAAFGAIAERFRRAGALEQAVSLCREGLQKFPDHVSARVTLGWSLLDLGKYDEARLELEQVMRRAPDNLAAIRGLAELHDRFEHTLNLPMDGPGQWPPPADSVELHSEARVPSSLDAGDASVAAAVEEFDSGAAFADAPEFGTPSMTPPEMGLPLWAPTPAASAMVEETSNNHALDTGARSLWEIDAFAGAPLPVQAMAAQPAQESAPMAPIEMAVEDLGVLDETLAALIAESASLEAAADLHVQSAPAIESPDSAARFGESIEIEAGDFQSVEVAVVDTEGEPQAVAAGLVELDEVPAPLAVAAHDHEATPPAPAADHEQAAAPVAIAAAAIEPAATQLVATAPAVIELVATEPAAVELPATEPPAMQLVATGSAAIELAAIETAIELAAIEPAAIELAATEPVAVEVGELEITPDVVLVEAAEADVELASAAMDLIEVETPSRQAEIQPAEGEKEVERTAEVLTFASRLSPASQVDEFGAVQLPDEQAATQPVASPGKGTAAVVSLEGMLVRVQARRRQLMAQSVA